MKIRYLVWGAKNHPGNALYFFFLIGIWVAAFRNKDLGSGVLAATVFTILLGGIYVSTSISIGKANKNHIGTKEIK